jgi:hypothetical protein
VANLAASKLSEPKVKAAAKTEVASNKNGQGQQNHLPTQMQHGTGIPKPTAAIKGRGVGWKTKGVVGYPLTS